MARCTASSDRVMEGSSSAARSQIALVTVTSVTMSSRARASASALGECRRAARRASTRSSSDRRARRLAGAASAAMHLTPVRRRPVFRTQTCRGRGSRANVRRREQPAATWSENLWTTQGAAAADRRSNVSRAVLALPRRGLRADRTQWAQSVPRGGRGQSLRPPRPAPLAAPRQTRVAGVLGRRPGLSCASM